jgi:hypothetical protein
VVAFVVVLTGLSVPAAAVVGRFDAVVFLFTGAVGRTCAAATLVCRFGRSGMKRARATVELPPTSAPALEFGACGGGPTAAAAAVG